jgi:nucleotide-binding universal stress UspA family protein
MAILQIMCPVDYSDCSRVALEYAADLGKKLGVPIDVIHIWDRPSFVTDKVMVRDTAGGEKSLIQMIAENAEAEMAAFIKSAKLPPDIQIEHHLLSGEPATRVLEELRQGRHDLVVVGTHGRSGFQHLLLGIFAEKLVRHAPVPVLTVR